MKQALLLLISAASLHAAHPALEPVPREPEWCLQHHQVLNGKAARGDFEVMFFGDSITWEWEANADTGAKVWPQLADYRPATFAVSGDRTEHLLWRLLNGNLKTPASPKAAVILIGTNNLGQRQDSPQAVTDAVLVILNKIKSQFPKCQLYLYGIFPRGNPATSPIRQAVVETNALLEKAAQESGVRYVDISSRFLKDDGVLDPQYYRDGLHLSAEGYRIWAESLKDVLPPPSH